MNGKLAEKQQGRLVNPQYGLRPDGTPKGTGYLGVLKRPDGKEATEYSIGVNIEGKEVLIPTIVPTLTPEETNSILQDKLNDQIINKAVQHAIERMRQGKNPFAN